MLFVDLEDSLNAFIKRTETLKFPNDYARDWSWIYCYKFFTIIDKMILITRSF